MKLQERDVSRLPKWAQRKIEHLESAIRANREYYAGLSREMQGDTETPVVVDLGSGIRRFLPIDADITWKLPSGQKIEVSFDREHNTVEVRKHADRGDHRLGVYPIASNVVEVV